MAQLFKRRGFLKATAAASLTGLLNPVLAESIQSGLNASDLVYLTPIQSNGTESACQAEIWFVYDGSAIYVCTDTNSWRAAAPRLGLTMTRIWVGDLGRWQSTNGEYKNLPALMASASIESKPAEQQRVLELFGDKYSMSWLLWGPRFRKGLKNGSQTLLKYQPVV
tara:strand:- start:210 stop:707 length:498 start_codon:yes stop_codon:yes gene_type:complete